MSELSGHADGGHLRSNLNEFDITTAVELEAHVNMNAAAAKVNFDKYYAGRLADVSKLWKEEKNRLAVKPMDVPVVVIDVSTPKFDFSTIVTIFKEKKEEREAAAKQAKEADSAEEVKDLGLRVFHPRFSMDDPLTLKLKGCDYVTVDKVVDALKEDTTVKRLDLSEGGLEGDDCEALAKLFSTNKTLTTVSLGGNKIGNDGMAKLCAGLRGNTTITDLDLGANDISKTGAIALSAALGQIPALERLQLAGNKLGIYGGEALVAGLRSSGCKLKTLGLQNNNLGDDGVRKLAEAFGVMPEPEGEESAASSPPPPGNPNTTLVEVNLDANRASDESLALIEKALFSNEQLQARVHFEDLEAHERATREAECDADAKSFGEMVSKVMAAEKTMLEERLAAEAEKKKAEEAKKQPAGKKSAAPPPKPSGKGAAPSANSKTSSKSPVKQPAPKPAAKPAPPANSKAVAKASGKVSPKKTAKK